MDNWNTERWTWKRAVRQDGRLSDAAKLLAVSLCDDFAHHKTGYCNPSVGKVATALGKSDRAVQRAIKDLLRTGWIGVKYARGRGRSSEITFLKGDANVPWAGVKKAKFMSSCGPEKVTEVSKKR